MADEHEYCDNCGDCTVCDVEHYCVTCGRCQWDCDAKTEKGEKQACAEARKRVMA